MPDDDLHPFLPGQFDHCDHGACPYDRDDAVHDVVIYAPILLSGPPATGMGSWGAVDDVDHDDPVVIMRLAAAHMRRHHGAYFGNGLYYSAGSHPSDLEAAANAIAGARRPTPTRWDRARDRWADRVRQVADIIDGQT